MIKGRAGESISARQRFKASYSELLHINHQAVLMLFSIEPCLVVHYVMYNTTVHSSSKNVEMWKSWKFFSLLLLHRVIFFSRSVIRSRSVISELKAQLNLWNKSHMSIEENPVVPFLPYSASITVCRFTARIPELKYASIFNPTFFFFNNDTLFVIICRDNMGSAEFLLM